MIQPVDRVFTSVAPDEATDGAPAAAGAAAAGLGQGALLLRAVLARPSVASAEGDRGPRAALALRVAAAVADPRAQRGPRVVAARFAHARVGRDAGFRGRTGVRRRSSVVIRRRFDRRTRGIHLSRRRIHEGRRVSRRCRVDPEVGARSAGTGGPAHEKSGEAQETDRHGSTWSAHVHQIPWTPTPADPRPTVGLMVTPAFGAVK